MRGLRIGVIAVLGVLALVVGALAPAGAQSGNEKPAVSEIGVSSTQIRIAVLVDVDNSFAPGLFKGSVDGVKGVAKYVNSEAGGGGIAGRKLVVDFIDTHVNPNDTRNATIAACTNDFALVGSSMALLTSIDDIANCKDQAGQPTGVPDLGSVVVNSAEACLPTSFPAIGSQTVCSTAGTTDPTYNGNQGSAKWLASQHKAGLHGLLLHSNDSEDGATSGLLLGLADERGGITLDQKIGVSGKAPQSAYTPFVQQMKSASSNYALNTAGVASALALRNEAQLQGFAPPGMVWDCVSCYGQKTVMENASAFEGQYQALGYLPLSEKKANKTVALFDKYVGEDADQFAASGWFAGLAFVAAARDAIQQHGMNGLTRTNLITSLKAMTDFDAGGMAGAHSFKTGATTACFVQMQFRGGKWVRLYPKKPGTMDCKPSNAVQVKASELKTAGA